MFLALLPLLLASVWADSFLYLHPSNPEFHPRDVFPQQKTAPRGKIKDLPQSGIIYLKRIKPLDPLVKAFGSQTVNKTEPVDIPPSKPIKQEQLTPLTQNTIEEDLTDLTAELENADHTATSEVIADGLPESDVDALDDILKSLKTETLDPKTDEESHKSPRLITLRGTRVAGSATTHRRPPARLVRLGQSIGSTATLKSTPEFDPWERIGQ